MFFLKLYLTHYQYPPVFSYEKLPDGNYTHHGIGYDYLQWIKEYFDFRCVHTHFIDISNQKIHLTMLK